MKLNTITVVTVGGLLLTSILKSKEPSIAHSTASVSALELNMAAPERSGPLGGYADIVDKASPSVVSIFATARVERPQTPQNLPNLFNDPMFRYFFGNPSQRNFQQPRSTPAPTRQGLGSGVIITPDGFIVTNNHVIDDADEIKVQLKGDRKSYDAEVIGRDPATDLALIKIGKKDLPAISIADSAALRPGDLVFAIGNPFGLNQTITSGIVSAIGRKNLSITDYSNFIQTDASINPGNSGGALIDNKGRLVGINTAIFSRSGGNVGIGFAIPSDMTLDVVKRLATDGEVTRGYLGVMLSDLTPEIAAGFKVEPKGALVNDVMDDTPASKAGFKSGDIVKKYRGKTVNDMADLRLQVANTPPNTKSDFEIIRNGKTKILTAKIGLLPGKDGGLASSSWGSSQSANEILDGVVFSELTDQLRENYNLPKQVEGIVVKTIDPSSNAALAGIGRGDIVTKIGNSDVSTIKEAVKARQSLDGEMVIVRVVNSRGARFIAVMDAEN